MEVYIINEPVADYTVSVWKIRPGSKEKSYQSRGFINNSIEEDMADYIRKGVNKTARKRTIIEGVIYSAGKMAVAIRWKG